MAPNIRIAFYVAHKGADKMAGRAFVLGNSLFVFHEEKGSQYHIRTNCSAPIDVILVEHLRQLKLNHGFAAVYFVHRVKGSARVQQIEVDQLPGAPIETWDGRRRYYLDDARWYWRAFRPNDDPGYVAARYTVELHWDALAEPESEAPPPAPLQGRLL